MNTAISEPSADLKMRREELAQFIATIEDEEFLSEIEEFLFQKNLNEGVSEAEIAYVNELIEADENDPSEPVPVEDLIKELRQKQDKQPPLLSSTKVEG